jgi:TolB-like protein/DNA-binding winged helix-turn-helix (wHTH) protein/Tfp pilus assembly protein PilF
VDDAEREHAYVFEGFRLDTRRRTLLGVDGRPVPLAPKTLDTLCHLVARAGELVGKRELLEAIWPHVIVEENNLTQAISQLRRALGERPEEHRFIVTEPGRGYRFVANVTVEAGSAPEALPNAAANGPAPPVLPDRPASHQPRLGLAVAAVVTAGIAAAAWYVEQDRSDALPNSVAVLPFENLSPDPANAFFASGLHGEIVSQLAKISALNVIGQASVRRVTDTARPVREIATELNVETVLYVTVEYANGRVRVRPQLVSGATGRTLWAESYDRGFEDIFAIESEVAAEVANALKAEFSVAEQAAVDTPPTKSPAAYAAYLRARAVGNTSDELALEYLDEATRLDPTFVLAHAAKAEQLAASLIARIGREAAAPSEWSEIEQRIRSAADEALRLDPNVWLAHLALGNLHERRWRWTEAHREYERASASAPRGVRGAPAFEPFFRDLDFTHAIREQREIVALNPRVAQEHWVLGLFHAYEHDAEAAAEAFREAISLTPDDPVFHVWLAHAESMLGQSDEAVRELRRAEQLPIAYRSSITIVNLAYAYSQNERPEDASRLFEIFAARSPDRRHQAGHWALAHLAVGNDEAARQALEVVIDKIAKEEPDAGYTTLRLIRTNLYADPVLDQHDFVLLRDRLRGH